MAAQGAAAAGTGRAALLSGWGRAMASQARLVSLRSGAPESDVAEVMCDAQAGFVARGLGRSYGDAAQCGGGTVLDCTALDRILRIDAEAGWADVQAGASLDRLMRATLPLGRFVPVTPGTRQVTIGGAIAADIHGKNHHVAGAFGTHVLRLRLATPAGVVEVGPDSGAELFWATVGGMGLTGVILSARVSLLPVESSAVRVDTERASDLDDLLEKMERGDQGYRYSVAWIDCLARGRNLGRGVLTRGDHARREDLSPSWQGDPLRLPSRPLLTAPPAPSGLLNRFTVAAFNEAWYRKAPKRETGRIVALQSFFHQLDAVAGWNRLYGPRGFLQYQMVVPFGSEGTLADILQRLAGARCASFLGVLKRFGPGDPAPLSFPTAGWTLALDLPVGPRVLGPLLDELDVLVTEAGGRVYLAKDSRLRPELLAAQYPRLEQWRRTRQRADPRDVLCSDLCRRLDLAGHHGGPPQREAS
ncbi:MAG: FAD-binding protein [Acidimicrobiales bacterium]